MHLTTQPLPSERYPPLLPSTPLAERCPPAAPMLLTALPGLLTAGPQQLPAALVLLIPGTHQHWP
eukprot:scaffold4087_cov14-Tisochrysis_lutea.AAC.1